VVHRAAEKIVARLTGKSILLADESNNRSILSLRDETPGVIALHSPLVAAEIFFDNEFVGYTQGNMQAPILIEGVAPGRHSVRTSLGNDFGVVKLPEVEFRNWEALVDVKPGRRHAIRDETRHFNDFLYKLEGLIYQSATIEKDKFMGLRKKHELSYIDRKGASIPVQLEVTPSSGPDSAELVFALRVGAIERSVRLAWPARPDGPAEIQFDAGTTSFSASLRERAGSLDAAWSLKRTDVYQNMFREKR
jgi:hypothetical protein